MKRFWTVFEFELMSYAKNKSFMITTILAAVLLGGIMFLPRFVDMSRILAAWTGSEENVEEVVEVAEGTEDVEKTTALGILDGNGYFSDDTLLEQAFPEADIIYMEDETELKEAVQGESIEAGFYVIDDENYRYYVLNKGMYDTNKMIFDDVLSVIHKQVYCRENHLDYNVFVTEYEAPINCEEEVLGKEAGDSFWYCYALVIVIFMLIVLYGVMIATSVTTEKSNRSIEVLVTSIDSKYLLFGKVLAGTAAVVLQLGLVLGSALIGYGINHEVWGNALDMVLDIPGNVLLTFAVFGIGGFLFYAFLYGALGALVSKTEDINKSVGPLQMIIMLVYLATLFQLDNVDGIIIKVCSFLPFSSYSAMFVRIGMGTVAFWEVAVSAVVLYVSIFFTGWLAAKIYRMGTLRYGNPIKLSKALKDLKNQAANNYM